MVRVQQCALATQTRPCTRASAHVTGSCERTRGSATERGDGGEWGAMLAALASSALCMHLLHVLCSTFCLRAFPHAPHAKDPRSLSADNDARSGLTLSSRTRACHQLYTLCSGMQGWSPRIKRLKSSAHAAAETAPLDDQACRFLPHILHDGSPSFFTLSRGCVRMLRTLLLWASVLACFYLSDKPGEDGTPLSVQTFLPCRCFCITLAVSSPMVNFATSTLWSTNDSVFAPC